MLFGVEYTGGASFGPCDLPREYFLLLLLILPGAGVFSFGT